MARNRVSLKGMGAELFFGPVNGESATGAPIADPMPIEFEALPSPTASSPSARIPDNATATPSLAREPAVRRDLADPFTDSQLDERRPSESSRSTSMGSQIDIPRASTTASKLASMQAIPLDSLQDSKPASELAIELARAHHGMSPDDTVGVVQAIRKVVRVSGKEVSYVRLTPEEKAQLADIIYAYKRQGQKTSENEIHRVALNFLLNDYHERGDHSLLAKVLASLQA